MAGGWNLTRDCSGMVVRGAESDDAARTSPCGYREFAMEIGWYQSIAISARVPMDVRKRMEVVPLLFDHHTMSSDQKCNQIRCVTMVDG